MKISLNNFTEAELHSLLIFDHHSLIPVQELCIDTFPLLFTKASFLADNLAHLTFP